MTERMRGHIALAAVVTGLALMSRAIKWEHGIVHCTIGGGWQGHYFQSRTSIRIPPDGESRHYNDLISWPNFHSGAKRATTRTRGHGFRSPVLVDSQLHRRVAIVSCLFTHEGAVGARKARPQGHAQSGYSKVTGRRFNIAGAFEPARAVGPRCPE